MKLAILAGGKGTRLGRSDLPKPMIEVHGKPVLEWQIELARRHGLTDISLLTGHLAPVIQDYFGDGSSLGVSITHVVEPVPLGSAGAVLQLRERLDERFMLFYGDTVMDIDLDRLIAFDRQQHSLATLVVHPNDHPFDSDLVEADSDGVISRFLSKPHPPGLFYRNLVNAALYILDPDIFSCIPTDGPSDFGRDIFPAALASGKRLRAYCTPEYIKDMGTPDRLEHVQSDFARGQVSGRSLRTPRPAFFLDRDGVINKEVGNLSDIDAFELLDGVPEAIRLVNAAGFLAVVVTNQPVLAKGFLSVDGLHAIHNKMETLLGARRAYLDAIYYCPHHPDKGFPGEVPELKRVCDCRKPQPGMILQAARDFSIDLTRSYMIGDQPRDIQAGKQAGVQTVLIASAAPANDAPPATLRPDFVFPTLETAVRALLERP